MPCYSKAVWQQAIKHYGKKGWSLAARRWKITSRKDAEKKRRRRRRERKEKEHSGGVEGIWSNGDKTLKSDNIKNQQLLHYKKSSYLPTAAVLNVVLNSCRDLLINRQIPLGCQLSHLAFVFHFLLLAQVIQTLSCSLWSLSVVALTLASPLMVCWGVCMLSSQFLQSFRLWQKWSMISASRSNKL